MTPYQNNKIVTHLEREILENKKIISVIFHLLLLQIADTHDVIISFIIIGIETGYKV